MNRCQTLQYWRKADVQKAALWHKKISPACAYCTHGSPAADQKMVLCKNRGVVSPYFACRKFRYDPLLRVPHRQELPHYDPKDFSMED